MRSAGCVINDYADRHFDGQVERTQHRPFARGVVSEREALLAGRRAGAGGVHAGAAAESADLILSLPALFLAGSYPSPNAFFRHPAGLSGIAFWLWYPDGLCRRAGPGAGHRLADAAGNLC